MIVLGRPTLALSVVLFSTLLGTGWSRRRGTALSVRQSPARHAHDRRRAVSF